MFSHKNDAYRFCQTTISRRNGNIYIEDIFVWLSNIEITFGKVYSNTYINGANKQNLMKIDYV